MVPPCSGCGWQMTPKNAGGAPAGVSISASIAPAGPASVCGSARAGGLLDSKQLDVEYQGCARRNDPARATLTVTERRRDDELALTADLHALDALIPALDHLTAAQAKAKRLVAILGAVELLALLVARRRLVQPARVMHHGGLARFDGVSGSGLDVGHGALSMTLRTPARRIRRRFKR